MNLFTAYVLIGIFMIAALYIILSRGAIRKLNRAIKNKDSSALTSTLRQKRTSLFVSEYVRDFYQAKAYLMDKDLINVKEHLRIMFHKSYSKHDVEQYLTLYFHFFIQEEDYAFALEILERIEETKLPSFIKYCTWTKAVLMDHESNHIEEMEKSIDDKEYYGFPLAVITYLVGIQKLYLEEKQEALEWVETALSVFMPGDIYVEKARKMKEALYKEAKETKPAQ